MKKIFICHILLLFLSQSFVVHGMEPAEQFTLAEQLQLSDSEFLFYQKTLIPSKYALETLYRFPIDGDLRINLNIERDSIIRNQFINKKYYLIGQKLSKCMGGDKIEVPVANWYSFATWGSLSAGSVISGKKFEDLGGIERIGASILGYTQIISDQKEQKEIFAYINAQIALELIPMGEFFLDTFCRGKKKDPKVFFSKFPPTHVTKNEHQHLLRKAFTRYYEAIDEQDENKKVELITLGSFEMVFAEQIRIDPQIKIVFSTAFGIAQKQFSHACTQRADFQVNTANNGTQFQLNEDVRAALTHPLLETIENKDLKEYTIDLPSAEVAFNILKPGSLTFPKTGTSDWSDYEQRARFLTALFKGHIANPEVMADPYPGMSLAHFRRTRP